eukprot:CAMPEP_0117037326 /NCGR_PEP_ID=MMETSP0472-20121206/26359_1 /TAXON_ID=693140 ORGANISM="Tiarina fusus, Strain LIS" /NCGR_SAMPLE_ID=MMETSP0472 /ASSEMBLY_ACC=CAM_ASM_000603 /LENGTH=156 /DNA_ID=CAMNT_0004747289 /DNA_START=42 /DNA_END=512 /DNA_ORIENTATION=+
MATDHQTERAFQKQPTIYVGNKRLLAQKGNKLPRYVKNVGLGFRTPREAVEGSYIDKKCPWTGNVSIRGKILRGIVKSTKMQRTLVVRRDYLHYIKKYNRFEKRHKNLSAHISPALHADNGDMVILGQCRPLSKTVRFNVLQVFSQGGQKKGFSKF